MAKPIEEQIKNLQDQSDFTWEPFNLLGANVQVGYFKTLVDMETTRKDLFLFASVAPQKQPLLHSLLQSDAQKVDEQTDIDQALHSGKLLLHDPTQPITALYTPAPANLHRSLSEPQTTNVINGPSLAFTEDIETNVAILRKTARSKHLTYRSTMIGRLQPRQVGLVYLNTYADEQLVQDTWDALQQRQKEELPDFQTLLGWFGNTRWSIFLTLFASELPIEAARALEQGRVVLFLDQYPMAVVTPGLATDSMFAAVDHNYPLLITGFLRALRVLGVLISLLAPSLYVALISSNPEVLRIQIALSVAQSREQVPYPSVVEVLFMLLFLELVIEASIRLPKSIGSTVTMVGGIILGQAVVEAQLVSNIVIIFVAAMTVANFAVNGFEQSLSIRVAKYLVLLLTSIYGIFGIVLGVSILIIHLASLQTLRYPYISIWKRMEPKK